MENLFIATLLLSLVLLFVGLINPKLSLFWKKQNQTRKQSSLIYGICLITSFILFGITSDNSKTKENTSKANSVKDTVDYQKKIAALSKSVIDSLIQSQFDADKNHINFKILVSKKMDSLRAKFSNADFKSYEYKNGFIKLNTSFSYQLKNKDDYEYTQICSFECEYDLFGSLISCKIEGIENDEQNEDNRGNEINAERKRKIEQQFSAWDGSHRNLETYIKRNMNDADSYEHVETSYWDLNDHIVVMTKFRGKNAYGAKVLNVIKAKVNLNGEIIEIIEQR